MTFEDLASQRRLLQDFCICHAPSVLAFQSADKKSFKITINQPETTGKLHITSTATCIESLLACPRRYLDLTRIDFEPQRAAKEFAAAAIARDPDSDWKSEGSAAIYCRCRGLPLTIDHVVKPDRLGDHIRRVLTQLKDFKDGDPTRFAIGEADISNSSDPETVKGDKREWYPPNAFHTFWTLEILRRLKRTFKESYLLLQKELELERAKDGMMIWSRRTLGYQVALHAANSSILDSDQLAWSLATLLKFEPAFPSDLGDQDLLRKALECLFDTQLKIGTWRHYRALFHYKAAGNAYCYVYETFAVLLGIALDGATTRQLLRDTLLQHVDKLTQLWGYANSTRVGLLRQSDGSEPVAIGWCSGHRLNQTEPESWATASVFSFAQAFRRLLGVWTREAARKELNLVKPVFEKTPAETLTQRGNTWTHGEKPPGVTEQLYTMFINPVLRHADDETLEPDTEPIHKHQARSAILFGPPGTSKTTLCKAVAASIGWDYVELYASHFCLGGIAKRAEKS